MVKQLQRQNQEKNPPIYTVVWEWWKHFPSGLAHGSKRPPTVSGVAAAAMISVAIGCFTMMVAHHLSETSIAADKIIWSIGSWIPGSRNHSPLWGNIGSYSGEQTVLLISWLVSWLILHSLWKKRSIKTKTIFFWFSTLLMAATIMSWHPFFPYFSLI
ncbi:hypothetical protein [Fortiea contorta]|uniref:hypothetical protein n=1 Tax=Fortiea contorta TaxID=1892405 RepID=UPI00034A1F80|nr:hypothetical protein [Fortiea contorta]